MKKSENPVVKILMQRDGLSVDEAIAAVVDCAEQMYDAIASDEDPEEIILQELGLEPDYVFGILGILE